MAIEFIDCPHDLHSNVEEEAVCHLVETVWQDEVHSVAERARDIGLFGLVKYLEDGEGEECKDSDIHHPPHLLPDLLIVLKEVGRLLGVEVADLEQDECLDEVRDDQDAVVDRHALYHKGVTDEN